MHLFSVGIVFGECTALNNEPETLGKKIHKQNDYESEKLQDCA